MKDPGDQTLGRLHKGLEILLRVGGSFFAAHLTGTGDVHLSATLNIRRAAVVKPGPTQLRQHLFQVAGPQQLVWLERKKEVQQLAKGQRRAWRQGLERLKQAAKEAEGVGRPFFMFAMFDSEQHTWGSLQGRQLMASSWWQDVVVKACSDPLRGSLLPAAGPTVQLGKKRRRAEGSQPTGSSAQQGNSGGVWRGAAQQGGREQPPTLPGQAAGSDDNGPGLPCPPQPEWYQPEQPSVEEVLADIAVKGAI